MLSTTVRVRMTVEQLARLDALVAESGSTRSAVLRRALEPEESSRVTIPPPSRERALELLMRAAQDGSVLAAVAVARELRLSPPAETFQAGPVSVDELYGERLRSIP